MILRLFFYFMFTFFLLGVSLDAGSSQTKMSGPEAVVARLYKDFAWETVMQPPDWKGMLDQPREILEQYFDETLASLLLQDRAYAEKQGMGRLDFQPIWDSQDPGASDMEIRRSSLPGTVLVKFRYPGNNQIVKLKYKLSRTAKGWRISNISGRNWSLLAILGLGE